jgi:RHS repeat-associated protein
VTTRYLVDDLNPTGYAQVIEDVLGGSVEHTYTYGNTLVSQNQPGNGQLTASFYGADAHGSVRLLTDSAGEVTNTYAYDAFGNLVSAFGTTPNDYLYSGERFDSDLGAYHLRERDYNPQRGRFLTSDPFAGTIDVPLTLHKYLYVGADPVNFIDPSGLAETTEYRLRIARLPCIVAKIDGVFSILDWTGYPGGLPKPDGPFKILEGAEQKAARKLADRVNRAIHARLPHLLGSQIHEIHPVNFGGSPTSLINKRALLPGEHKLFNKWWGTLKRNLKHPYGKC